MKFKNIEVVYSAILLDEESQEKLRKMAEKLLPERIPGIFSSFHVSCQHLTLAFGEKVSSDHIKLVGSPVTCLHPTRVLLDDLGCGLFFELKEFAMRELPWIGSSDGSMPHVTIYYRQGVPPAVIGTLPTRNHSVLIADPTYSLNGKVAVYCEDGQWYV